jgi:predicted nuclease of predicted toxin-antitoxin system
VKLLFDENLSARLARDLADLHPGSAHVQDAGLTGAADRAVRLKS